MIAYYEQNEVFISYISSKCVFLKLYKKVAELLCLPKKQKSSTESLHSQHTARAFQDNKDFVRNSNIQIHMSVYG